MNKLLLNIQGPKPKDFIIRLCNKKIKIYQIKYINKKEVNILIEDKNLESILKNKTIYEINIIKEYGKNKIKKDIIKSQVFIICSLLGILILFFLSCISFKIKIMHTDKEIINLLTRELNKNGIKEKTIKKDFKQIQKIKEKILNENKNTIEWLEIETKGIYYIIKVEERKLNQKSNNYTLGKIISKKDAIIKKIVSKQGNIVKNINDYVKKGDTVISDEILLNNNIVNYTAVEGTIYGEVWYNITVRYPYNYFNFIETKNTNKVLSFKLINKSINIIDIKKFDDKIRKEKNLFLNKFIPFGFVYYEEKAIIIDDSLESKDYLSLALNLGLKKINLDKDEYVTDYKVLNCTYEENELVLKLFVTVYENITTYSE